MASTMSVTVVSLGAGAPTYGQAVNKNSDRSTSVPETLRIYNTLSGTVFASHRMEGIAGGIAANETCIVSTRSGKATTAIFAWGRESPVSRFAAPEQIGPICFTNEGSHVVAGGVSGTIYVWEAFTGHLLCGWKAHYRKILTICFTDDDSILITGSDDAMVHMWDFCGALMNDTQPEKSLLKTFSSNKTAVTGLACGLGGICANVASSSLDHTCRVFKIASAEEQFCATFPSALLCVTMDLDGHNVYTGSIDGFIHIGVVSTGKTYSIPGHTAAVNSLKLGPANNAYGLALISGSDDGCLKWWDPITRSPLRTARMDGARPVKELLILDMDTHDQKSLKKRTEVSVPTLKKLKEADADDRWITVSGKEEFDWSTAEEVHVKPSVASIGQSSIDAKDEKKWKNISNRLFQIASNNALHTLSSDYAQ